MGSSSTSLLEPATSGQWRGRQSARKSGSWRHFERTNHRPAITRPLIERSRRLCQSRDLLTVLQRHLVGRDSFACDQRTSALNSNSNLNCPKWKLSEIGRENARRFKAMSAFVADDECCCWSRENGEGLPMSQPPLMARWNASIYCHASSF